MLADSVGSLLAYDALCRQPSQARVDTSEGEEEAEGGQRPGLVRQSSSRRTQTASKHLSVNNHEAGDTNFHFDVGHFFLLGSPLPIVLAHRQTAGQPQPQRPNCVQVYNLFHPSNPVVARLEPLLVPATHQISPINIPR